MKGGVYLGDTQKLTIGAKSSSTLFYGEINITESDISYNVWKILQKQLLLVLLNTPIVKRLSS